MASSSDMSEIETWAFRPAFDNSWISDAFSRDTDVLTKALRESISNVGATFTGDVSSDSVDTFSGLLKPETPSSLQQGLSVSTSGGSDPETASKRICRIPAPNPTGKITKRKKSRVSKRSSTTFITADPANFRQMVQEVTGVRFASSPVPVGSVLKPEAHRPVGVVNRVQLGYLLPTLDTSAFLLEHHQPAQCSLGFGPPAVVSEGGVGGGFNFDGFSSFPTLDSWKVV